MSEGIDRPSPSSSSQRPRPLRASATDQGDCSRGYAVRVSGLGLGPISGLGSRGYLKGYRWGYLKGYLKGIIIIIFLGLHVERV